MSGGLHDALLPYDAVLGLLVLERLFELWLSRRNTRALLRRGGVESGHRYFRVTAALNVLFILACALEARLATPPPRALVLACLLAALLAQVLRYWAVAALGGRWSLKLLHVPGERPVRAGPYRFVRHPNYLALLIETVAIPLAAGSMVTAALLGLLTWLNLRARLPLEERLLGGPYALAFEGVPRLIPVPWRGVMR